MDSFTDDRDLKLLENDKCTFFVLGRILGFKCELVLTDHERLIICHSTQPYPVWIWTADGTSEDELERAYCLADENSFLDGRHTINLKYEAAEYFIKRAERDGKKLSITTNLLAYECPEPIVPHVRADGKLHRCTESDVDTLVDFMDMFHKETDIDKLSRDEYRVKAEEGIRHGALFLWRNSEGRYVSSCSYRPNGDYISVGLVLTLPEFRRKHYAENLVYEVTCIAKSSGCMPMLYTDADYAASNECYKRIGYVLKGKLCTIG